MDNARTRKNAGFESLRVTLRLSCAERWHLDQVDLCVARQRLAFIEAAAVETALRGTGEARSWRAAHLGDDAGGAVEGPGAAQEGRAAGERAGARGALALLRDRKLLDRILADFAACGVVEKPCAFGHCNRRIRWRFGTLHS